MSSKESVYKQHEEHREWKNKLKFYDDEITILTGRLEEIVGKYTNDDVLAEAEKFQNQLIVQSNNIDMISHLINENDSQIVKALDNNPNTVKELNTKCHLIEKEKVETFEKFFNEFRHDFNNFAAKWM